MYKKSVYAREYPKKEKYKKERLLKNFKENYKELAFFNNSNPYQTGYMDYDGEFINLIAIENISDKYHPVPEKLLITIEKFGKDIKETSQIETLLMNEGFKKEK